MDEFMQKLRFTLWRAKVTLLIAAFRRG
jgi:hypothetical protein